MGGSKRTFFLATLFGFFTLLLSACGFHLKGMGVQSASTFTSLQFENQGADPAMVSVFARQLKLRNIQIVDLGAQADVLLTLKPTLFSRTKTGSTDSGSVGSELVKMTQPFIARDVKSDTLIVNSQVTRFRDRNIDDGALLSAERELDGIRKQMYLQLANQLIDRINRANIKRLK